MGASSHAADGETVRDRPGAFDHRTPLCWRVVTLSVSPAMAGFVPFANRPKCSNTAAAGLPLSDLSAEHSTLSDVCQGLKLHATKMAGAKGRYAEVRYESPNSSIRVQELR